MLPILGIFLALSGACLLALAMVTQRYALSYLGDKIPFCSVMLHKNTVWFCGLVLYGVANGLYASSLLYGPLSLLAGIFTTLLVFNMLFSWYMLGEELTSARIVGSVLILIGVVACVTGTPDRVETEFTPRDVISLTRSMYGSLYISILIVLISVSVGCILWFESRYPVGIDRGTNCISHNPGARDLPHDLIEPHVTEEVEKITVTEAYREDMISHFNVSSDKRSSIEGPPEWLDRAMCVLYPGSLGLDEGLAHLSMKATLSMLDTCEQANQCNMVIIYMYMMVWSITSIATLWWLRRVFTRYESTKALPVEYGTVNIVSVCSGLVFFREGDSLTKFQLVLVIVGVVVIVLGVTIGRFEVQLNSTTRVQLTNNEKKGGCEDEAMVEMEIE